MQIFHALKLERKHNVFINRKKKTKQKAIRIFSVNIRFNVLNLKKFF